MKCVGHYNELRVKFITLSLILLQSMLFYACGNKSSFDCSAPTSGVQCNPRTKDEDARIALDKGDMTTAVTLLKELIAGEPTKYERYPILAAALAGKSGFDVFNVVKSNFGGSESLIETLGSFLPTPTSKGAGYDASLADMNESVTTLTSVPESLRSAVSSDRFAASCSLQLVLYQSAYSIMLINKYLYTADGFDPSKLSTMSVEDATAILSNLLSASSVATGATGTEATKAVKAAYDSIQAQPGTTDQEKIAAYAKSTNQ